MVATWIQRPLSLRTFLSKGNDQQLNAALAFHPASGPYQWLVFFLLLRDGTGVSQGVGPDLSIVTLFLLRRIEKA